MQLHINPFECCLQIAGDFRIPEPDDAISLLLQPKLPLAIALGSFVVVMMSAVEFNDQTFRRAEEVDDVRADRRLTSEMGSFYRQFFQRTPQDSLAASCSPEAVWPPRGGPLSRS
jgi:hypothetical protein